MISLWQGLQIALMINENGDTLWTKTYTDSISRYASHCIQSNDGGFVITGRNATSSSDGLDILLMKTDINGNILWNNAYGNTGYEHANCVKQTSDGGYIISGDDNSSNDHYIFLVKTDSLGCIKPHIDLISGHLDVSLNDTIFYHCIDLRGQNYNWTSGNGEIISGQENDIVAITWDQLGTDTIQVHVSNDCGMDNMSLIILELKLENKTRVKKIIIN